MDTACLPDWDNEFEAEFPVLPTQRTHFGVDNDLVELLWQDGDIVLHNQSDRRPGYDPNKFKPAPRDDDRSNITFVKTSANMIQDEESNSWIHCTNDESFGKEFGYNFLYEIPSSNPSEAMELCGQFNGENCFKFGASDTSHVLPTSQHSDLTPISFPPSSLETFEPVREHRPLVNDEKASRMDLSVKKQGFSRTGQSKIRGNFSGMTVGSSHCSSNQIASSYGILNRSLSSGVDVNHARKVSPQSEECTDRETLEQDFTSSSGGSGSSFWRTSNLSSGCKFHKRKSMDGGLPECGNHATEKESASGNKSSQKSGSTRRSRVAEVHNLSERKRRDRINEKMRALQELIPHCNKSDKASMLDEAIEYMKSLQSQIQLMWMGSGITPVMQQYMSRLRMGIGPTTLPPIPNLMRMARLPQVYQAMSIAASSNQPGVGLTSPMLNPVIYQNQMQSGGFTNLYSVQNTSQPMNMFSFGSHTSQQLNHVFAPPGNGGGYSWLYFYQVLSEIIGGNHDMGILMQKRGVLENGGSV